MEPVSDILVRVRKVIADACAKAGRKPEEVEIVGVTKTHGPEVVREAWESGIRIMGENKVQEAAAKIPESVSGPDWHLIGHLQRNKVRAALELFSTIHSVDSIELLQTIDRHAGESGHRPVVLLEVNVAGESSKSGLAPASLAETIEYALSCKNLTLEGLMTMAPFSMNDEDARPHFRRLRELRDEMEEKFSIGLPRLSMGMSGDYRVAVEEGATWVRLGTVLFGARPKWKPQPIQENAEI